MMAGFSHTTIREGSGVLQVGMTSRASAQMVEGVERGIATYRDLRTSQDVARKMFAKSYDDFNIPQISEDIVRLEMENKTSRLSSPATDKQSSVTLPTCLSQPTRALSRLGLTVHLLKSLIPRDRR